ncbi:hypothetical protein HPP92_007348 [Vanilla planifolia]|uniref:Uncharacterized protein n=1 Tax=Vanilla planifolia TaxID=51239 RepID=A0A835RLM2_VANPL|nr:hypothetical protein HPP92_007348 [Vanilla planifolia]
MRDLVPYLSADGENGLAGKIHEDDLCSPRGRIVVNSEDGSPLASKTVKPLQLKRGLPPDRKRDGLRLQGDGRIRSIGFGEFGWTLVIFSDDNSRRPTHSGSK